MNKSEALALLDKGILIGQSWGYLDDEYSQNITRLETATGKTPAVLRTGTVEIRYNRVSQAVALAKSHIASGGLISFDFDEVPNPANGKWQDPTRVNFTRLFTNGTTENNKLRDFLGQAKALLQRLGDTPILIRPWHEMQFTSSGDPFWALGTGWWSGNQSQIVAERRQLFEYTRTFLDMDNLIWIASASNVGHIEMSQFYPEWFDAYGVSLYGTTTIKSEVLALRNRGKPFGLCEVGEISNNITVLNLVKSIGGKFATYWHSYPGGTCSIVDCSNASQMMNDSSVITLETIGEVEPPEPEPPELDLSEQIEALGQVVENLDAQASKLQQLEHSTQANAIRAEMSKINEQIDALKEV